MNFNFDNFISIHTKQLVLGLTAFFLIKIPVCRKENGESCYQLASESLVKVIASEPCSEPPMLLGD